MEKINKHFKPDFFIPGAAKSGTTTLHDSLNLHPEISMSKNKEPVYWNNKSFNNFDEVEIHRYSELFDINSKIKGESTTSYMYYDVFIKNIKKHYKNSPKFIFILRNPIDRFISHSNWMIGLGLEKNSIEEIIEKESLTDFNEYDYYPKNYYQFGLYHKWISRFIKTFGEENIKVITFENLINNRVKVLNSCFKFLGVKSIKSVEKIVSNKTNRIIFPQLYHFLKKTSIGRMKFSKAAKYILPNSIRFKIKHLIKYSLKNWISINLKNKKVTNNSRCLLRDLYIDDVKSLKKKLKYNFSEWKDFN